MRLPDVQTYLCSATAAAVVQLLLREPCSVYYFASFYVRQKLSCSFVPSPRTRSWRRHCCHCCVQEWDHTNFLVDLSGHHAHCRAISHHAGVKEIHRRTPTGETIVAAVDFIEGSASNRRAIDGYIKEVIKRWETTNQFYAQVYRSVPRFLPTGVC